MGTKRRLRNTSAARGAVSVEILDRYGVAKPVSFAELKFEEARAAEKRKRRAQKENG